MGSGIGLSWRRRGAWPSRWAWPSIACVAIDLRSFGGSALTADIDVPQDRTAEEMRRHSGDVRAGAEHGDAVAGAGVR